MNGRSFGTVSRRTVQEKRALYSAETGRERLSYISSNGRTNDGYQEGVHERQIATKDIKSQRRNGILD